MSAPTWELGKYVGHTPGRSPFSSDDDANNVPSSSPEENTKVSPLSQHSFFIPLWQRCIPASGRLSFAPFKLVIVHRLRKTGDTHEKARMVLQVGLNGVFFGERIGRNVLPRKRRAPPHTQDSRSMAPVCPHPDANWRPELSFQQVGQKGLAALCITRQVVC